MSEPSVRAGWRAFAWLAALNLAGIAITVDAFKDLCIYCEQSTGGDPTGAFLIGFAALAAAPIMGARSCGRRLWLLAGILAGIGGATGFALGTDLFGDLYAALVLGLAIEGAVAVRLPVPEAVVSRVVVVCVLSVLSAAASLVSNDAGLLVLAVAALPALALTDTIVAWRAARGPGGPAPTLTRP
jgi:hypothetical protein